MTRQARARKAQHFRPARVEHQELRAFNTALIGCCALDDWEIGAGCLGIIERMFVGISRWIGIAIVTAAGIYTFLREHKLARAARA